MNEWSNILPESSQARKKPATPFARPKNVRGWRVRIPTRKHENKHIWKNVFSFPCSFMLSLRHYLRAQSQGHCITDGLEETGVERGSAGRYGLKGRERGLVNQTNIGTVWKNEKEASSIKHSLESFERTRKGPRQQKQQWNQLKGQERGLVNQTNIKTVWKDEKGASSIKQTMEPFKGRERGLVNQTNIGTVWKDENGASSTKTTMEPFERTRKGPRQSNKHWNRLKGRERGLVNQTIGTKWKAEKGAWSIKQLLEPIDRQHWETCGSGWSALYIMGFPDCVNTFLNWTEQCMTTIWHKQSILSCFHFIVFFAAAVVVAVVLPSPLQEFLDWLRYCKKETRRPSTGVL